MHPLTKRRGLAVPILATASCFTLILVAGVLAGWLPAQWTGSWADHIVRAQAHFVDRFFPFDAVWYQRIASDLYVWDPAHPALKQDVAFFPLWPFVLRLVSFLVASQQAARWCDVALAAVFASASIYAFHRLASRLLPCRAATMATWLFALYPGASFLLLSYPTGLMNLLCILSLLAALDSRYWQAAACAGVVTATGPLGLGTAMAVWVCMALDERRRFIEGERSSGRMARMMALLGATGLLSISGLASFLLWQYVRFGDASAFITAQAAWAPPLPWLARIPHVLEQLLILPDFAWGLAYLLHAFHSATLAGLQAGLEKGVQTAALGMALVMLLACARHVPRVVWLQGAFTLALFIWFHSASRPGNSTLRLTYCAMTSFLGMAWLLRDRQRLGVWITVVSAAMLGCGAFLSAAGYHVV